MLEATSHPETPILEPRKNRPASLFGSRAFFCWVIFSNKSIAFSEELKQKPVPVSPSAYLPLAKDYCIFPGRQHLIWRWWCQWRTDWSLTNWTDFLRPVGSKRLRSIGKPLFPQEPQSPQGLLARLRMLLPIGNFRPHFGIHFPVIVVQFDLHCSFYSQIHTAKINIFSEYRVFFAVFSI